MSSKEGTIRAALGYPAFRSLLAGLAVSQVGDWMYNLALVTLVYQRTGSPCGPASPPRPAWSRWWYSARWAAWSPTCSAAAAS